MREKTRKVVRKDRAKESGQGNITNSFWYQTTRRTPCPHSSMLLLFVVKESSASRIIRTPWNSSLHEMENQQLYPKTSAKPSIYGGARQAGKAEACLEVDNECRLKIRAKRPGRSRPRSVDGRTDNVAMRKQRSKRDQQGRQRSQVEEVKAWVQGKSFGKEKSKKAGTRVTWMLVEPVAALPFCDLPLSCFILGRSSHFISVYPNFTSCAFSSGASFAALLSSLASSCLYMSSRSRASGCSQGFPAFLQAIGDMAWIVGYNRRSAGRNRLSARFSVG
ncbi:hypothetical protein C8J56DRAFT_1132795 [Mycena floridula]|nr:hypothetical protein C8J56DRAFT_1132795 [Mycena floridula]